MGIVIGIGLVIVAVAAWWGISERMTAQKKEELSMEMTEDLLRQPFTAKATIRLKDMTLEADVNRSSPQKLTMQVTEPAVLEGLTFTYDGETVGISFQGMRFDLADDSLTAKMAAKVLLYTINSASEQSGVTVIRTENGISIRGENEQGDFEILLDREKGSILKCSMPNLELECSFTDFLFQQEQTLQ